MLMRTSTIRARINAIDADSGSAHPSSGAGDRPVGSRYWQTSGGAWLKVGTGASRWLRQMRTARTFNVRDYGALGDGVTDDRAAIQLAINAAIAAGGGIVYFPAGTYICNVIAGVVDVFLLSGAAQSKIWFKGSGGASAVHMNGNGQSADKVLFHVRDGAKYVGWSNLRMKSTITAGTEAEQQHLILIENRSTSTDLLTGRVFIRDCYMERVRGDAIRLLGNSTKRVAEILCKRVVGSMASPAGQRSRSLFQFQRAVDDVTIECCYADSNSSAIDFEPTGTGSNERNRFLRSHFVGQVALTGNGAGFEHARSVFSNNTMIGSISSLNVERMTFVGNIVDHQGATVGEAALVFTQRTHSVTISDNIVYQANDTNTLSPLTVNYQVVGENSEVIVSGNLVTNACNIADGGGISLQNTSRSIVADNMVRLAVNVAAKGFLIRIEPTTEAITDITVIGNMGRGTSQSVKSGIVFNGGNTEIVGNVFSGINAGAQVAVGRTEQYTVADNILAGATSSINGLTDYICVGGVGNSGPSIYVVVVAAEGTCPGVAGSIALRTVGGGANTTWAVRESIPTSVTGWVTK